jgi:hypothetical protein
MVKCQPVCREATSMGHTTKHALWAYKLALISPMYYDVVKKFE